MRFYNTDKPWELKQGPAIAVAGTLLSAQGAQDASDAQKKQLKQQARLQGLQADERLKQLGVESDIFESRARVAAGDTVSSYAKAGVDVGSGSPLLVLANQERDLRNSQAELERKGRAEANLMRQGAMQLSQAANDLDPSAAIAGGVLSGLGTMLARQEGGK